MLKGDRVVLRAIQRADLPRLWELISDFEVSILASSDPAFPWSLAELEAQFDESAAHPQKDRLRLAIEVDGELVGSTGFHRIDHFNRGCELGIAIGREFWGKGFGQDAVRTMVDYAFENLNMNRVTLYVLADDPRAVGAYRKAGFVEEGRFAAGVVGEGPLPRRSRDGRPARGVDTQELVLRASSDAHAPTSHTAGSPCAAPRGAAAGWTARARDYGSSAAGGLDHRSASPHRLRGGPVILRHRCRRSRAARSARTPRPSQGPDPSY